MLPWALDTLDVAGKIRADYIRLQNWIKIIYGDPAGAPAPKGK